MRLLLAEDDLSLAEVLERGLGEEGYVLDVVGRGDDALHLLRIYDYTAAVLDWRMPGLQGDEVVRRARRLDIRTPILMLTARDATPDKVLGLDAGADDYVVKPVDFDELVARLRAIQRRPRQSASPDLEVGRLALDPAAHTISVAGAPLGLTRREYMILELLMRRHPGPADRATIARHVWPDEADAVGSNTIDVHISHLRRKLAASSSRVALVTVRGVGHRLRAG
jgi:DNA-binding response OmpR family regulator